jgi:hypothetical protein
VAKPAEAIVTRLTLVDPAVTSASALDAPSERARESRRPRTRIRGLAPFALLLVAAGCWAAALAAAHPLQATNFGLLKIMGPLYIVAIVAVCAAFAVEFIGLSRGWVLTLATLALIALIRATTPIILHPPEYAWTYKHFGIANSLSGAGKVVDPHDIYQLWPTFFALIGQLGAAAGVDPERVGAWSSFAFGLIDTLFIYALLRGIRVDRRTALLSVFLFQAALWTDDNYFSPQAFAFALALGFWYLILRFCIRAPQDSTTSRNPLARRVGSWAVVATPHRPTTGLWGLLPVIAICFVFFAITASHQLTPYMLILSVAGLTIFDLVRPRWLLLPLIGIAVGYFIPNAGEVTSQYTIFSFNIFANASGNAVHARGSTGELVSVLAARGLTFLVWGAAAYVVIRRRRNAENLLLPLILALTAFGILVAGNYGGEAVYRVILFSLPWFVVIPARELASGRWAVPDVLRGRGTVLRRSAGLAVVASLMVLGGIQAAQGAYSVYAISPLEVQASNYFYAHAPVGSSLTLLVQDFPTRLSSAYVHINEGLPTDPALVDDDHLLSDRVWNASVIPEMTSDVMRYPGTSRFLVISTRMRAYLAYFGIRTPGAISSLETAFDHSPRWSVWYRNSDTVIYRYRGATVK